MNTIRKSIALARLAMRAARFLITARAALPRWLAILIVFGMLPIPGPVDNGALIVALVILWVRYRSLLRVCWHAATLDA